MDKVVARRRNAERNERVERILGAAKKLFLERGYFDATVRDIAKMAELSVGPIYFYFRGKDEIYGEVCKEAFHVLLKLLDEAIQKSGTPIERLRNLGLAYVKFYADYGEYFDILTFRNMGFKKVGLPDNILKELDSLSKQVLSIVNREVKEGIEQGYIKKGDSWEITISLWSSLDGLLSVHKRGYLENYGLDLIKMFDVQTEALIKGMT